MVHAVDVGYLKTKDSQHRIFTSAFTYSDAMLSDANKVSIDGRVYYFGSGNTTADVDKIDNMITKVSILSSIAMSGSNEYSLVLGLPIIQYKEKKEKLRSMVMEYNKCEVVYNAHRVNFRIKDILVCPQGIGALYTLKNAKNDMILFDIGSYTINVALVEFEDGNPKIKKHDTWYDGVMMLYQNVIDEVNRRYDLTLDARYSEKILTNGEFLLDGVPLDLGFLKPIILEYLEPIFTKFKLKYEEYKAVPTVLIGGGANLLYSPFEKTIKNCMVVPDSQFANVMGYYNYGLQKFDKYNLQKSY